MRVDRRLLSLCIVSFIFFVSVSTPLYFQSKKESALSPEETEEVIAEEEEEEEPEEKEEPKTPEPPKGLRIKPEVEPKEPELEEEPEEKEEAVDTENEPEEEEEKEEEEEEKEEEFVDDTSVGTAAYGSPFSLSGNATLNLPLGIGKVDVAITGKWVRSGDMGTTGMGKMDMSGITTPAQTKTGLGLGKRRPRPRGNIVFEAQIKKTLRFADVLIKDPTVVFSTDGTFFIKGSANVLGKDVVAYLRGSRYIDQTTGKKEYMFDFRGELVSKKPFRPFKNSNVVGLQDVTISDPFIGITLGKVKRIYFGGTATILDIPCNVKLEIAGAKKLSLYAVPALKDLDLTKISPVLAPVTEVLDDIKLVASTYNYYEPNLKTNIVPGITFSATIFPQKIPGLDKVFEAVKVQPKPAQFVGKISTPTLTSFLASIPIDITLMSKKLYQTPFDIPKIVLKNLQLILMGTPPQIAFQSTVEVIPRINDLPLIFSGAFTINPLGVFGIQGGMKGRWVDPFGLRGIVIEDVGLEFSARPDPVTVIMPQKMGFTGITILGDQKDPKNHVRAELTTLVDLANPRNIVFFSSINHLTLRDIASIPKNLGAPIELKTLPNVGIHDVELNFAPFGGLIRVGPIYKRYPMGIRFKGRVEILDRYAEADFRVNMTPGLDMGVLMFAKMPAFNVGPLKISGAGEDREYGTKDDGPIARLALTPRNQELYLSGLVDFFESRGNVEVSIDLTGVDIDTKLKLFNVFDSELHIHSEGGLDFEKLALTLDGKIIFGRQKATISGRIDTKLAQLKFFLNRFTIRDSVEAAILLGAGIREDIRKIARLEAEAKQRKAEQEKIKEARIKAEKKAAKISPPKLALYNHQNYRQKILESQRFNTLALSKKYLTTPTPLKLIAQVDQPNEPIVLETDDDNPDDPEEENEPEELIDEEEEPEEEPVSEKRPEAKTKEVIEEKKEEPVETEKEPEESIGKMSLTATETFAKEIFEAIRKKRVKAPLREGLEIKEEELRKNLTKEESEELNKILNTLPDIGFKNLKFNLNYALPDYFKEIARAFEENGIGYKGKIEIPEINLYGTALVSLSREKGLIAEASMKKWKFGPLLVTGSGPDKLFNTEDDGPYANLILTQTQQSLTLSGSIDLFGSTGAGIFLDIGKDGFTFNLDAKILNAFDATIYAKTLEGYKAFELNGKIKLGRQYARLYGYLGKEDKDNVLLFHLNELSLEGCLETTNDIIEGAIKKRPIPAKALEVFSPLLEFRDINIGIAGKEVVFEGYKYPPGFSLEGTTILPLVKIPVHLKAQIDNNGFRAQATAPKMNIGPLKVSGTGLDKKMGTADDGPVVYLEISKTPKFYLDGIVDFFGIKSRTSIDITSTSFSFETSGKFANLFQSYFHVVSTGTTKQTFDFIAEGELQSDFYLEIKKQMRRDVKNFQKGVSKGIDEAKKEVNKINGEISKTENHIKWRQNKIRSLQKTMKQRIWNNQQKLRDAQANVNKEREKVKIEKEKLANARRKVFETEKKCKDLYKWWSMPLYWGCIGGLKIAQAAIASIEAGMIITTEIGLHTALAALEIAKGTCELDPKNLKEHTEITKWGTEISGLSIARTTLISSRNIANGILEGAKQTAIGLSEAAKNIAEGALNIEKLLDIKKATIYGSLRDFLKKGILPKITLTVTTLGTTKTASFQFNLNNPANSVGQIAGALVKLAFTK